MKVGAFGRGLALAVLYIGILLVLVVWQFPIDGEFTLASGDFVLRVERGNTEGSLLSGVLGYGGLTLRFSPSRPLAWTAQDGTRMSAVPKSFKTTADGFVVYFSDGLELRAYSAKDPVSRAGFEFVRRGGALKNVTLTVETARRSRISQEKKSFYLLGPGSRYLIEVPEGSFSADRKTITLPFLRGRVAPVLLTRAEEDVPAASVRFLEQEALDPAAFTREISAWRDKAWRGLSSERFAPESLRWRDASGEAAFSETALTAYLAEALSRGSGLAALEQARTANALYPDRLTYLSVPYLGHTTERMKALEESDLAEVRRIERLVQAKSPALLEKPGLVRFLLDRSPYSLARDAFQVVQGLDLGSLTAAQAVGGLAAWAEAEDLFQSGENPFARFSGIPERQILPAIVKTSEGFFLTTASDGSSNLETSIRAGWALMRLGESTGKTMFTGIGQSLILGSLRLSDSLGFLPRSVVVRNGGVADKVDVLSPEEAYPLVARNPYYPREVSFFKEVGPSAWVWTCSPSVSVSVPAGSMVWTLEFPEQGVHYIAAYGVRPFAKMQLYGLDYPMDPAFENYNASGYLYRRAANVVYFKMRHRSRTEDIRMFY